MRTCDILEWDSAFFGRRIARFQPRQFDRCAVAALLAECRDSGIDCVYILVDASDRDSVAAAQSTGACLTDIRVTFGTEAIPSLGRAARVRPAAEGDVPALKQIAAVSHRHTRFYADKHFPTLACDRLYEVWIEKSCQGYAETVLVIDDDRGSAAGYVTCHRDSTAAGHIGLFAVRDDAQGRGMGRELLNGAFEWFAGHGVTRMDVATQLRNGRALRLYGRGGLVITSAGIWFHLWPGDAR